MKTARWLAGCWMTALVIALGRAQAPGLVEERQVFPAHIDGCDYRLEAMVYRPADDRRHPLVVFSHGRNGLHPARNPDAVRAYAGICRALAAEGLAVVMVVRRGYGNSDGPEAELRDTAIASGLEAAKDFRAAAEYWRGREFALPDKVVLMGHSQGGWSALAAGSVPIDGVLGVVNIAGGTNYALMGSGSVTPAVQEHWVAACRELGRDALVPSYWVYTENDPTHPGPVARRMFESYNAGGGFGYLLMLPAYGSNGHAIVNEPALFLPQLGDFLATIGLREEAAAAPSFVAVTGGGTVAAGSTVVFVVHLTANPLPILQWRRDGSALRNDGHVAGATSAALTIFGVQAGDAGAYTVTATNAVGAAVSSPVALSLPVADVPPPVAPAAPAGGGGGGAVSLWLAAGLAVLAAIRKCAT